MGEGYGNGQPEVVERQLVLTKRGSVPFRLNLTTRLTRSAGASSVTVAHVGQRGLKVFVQKTF